MVEADLMKSAFDNADFRGADLRKARLNLSNFNNCQFAGAVCEAFVENTPYGEVVIGGMLRLMKVLERH